MERKKNMRFIVENSKHLTEIDKLNLLNTMHRRQVKISESSDGSRIWLDRLPLGELLGIKGYIEDVMKRDAHHFLTRM